MLVNSAGEALLLCRLMEASAPLSGELIAGEMGVSRVAVWKRIQALQARGCPVESGPGGYRFLPEDINADLWRLEAGEIAGRQSENPAFSSLDSCELDGCELDGCKPAGSAPLPGSGECRLSLPSTMEAVKEAGRRGDPAGTCLVAGEQTAGRSRDSRRWESPPGGYYASFLLRPPWPLAESSRLPLLAAQAVCRCLRRFSGKPGSRTAAPLELIPGEKGDILLPEGEKIGGILVEAEGQIERIAWAVTGIGLHPHPELPSRGRRDRLTRMLRKELLKETL